VKLIRPAAIAAALVLLPLVVSAGPARSAITKTPTIDGRELPGLILQQPVRINRFAPGLTNRDMFDRLMGQMLAGFFVPVSEDANGVYYQGVRGFQRAGMTSSVPAGLCVSKTRAHTIIVYTGEARDLSAELLLDIQSLPRAELAKLKVAAPAGKAAK